MSEKEAAIAALSIVVNKLNYLSDYGDPEIYDEAENREFRKAARKLWDELAPRLWKLEEEAGQS